MDKTGYMPSLKRASRSSPSARLSFGLSASPSQRGKGTKATIRHARKYDRAGNQVVMHPHEQDWEVTQPSLAPNGLRNRRWDPVEQQRASLIKQILHSPSERHNFASRSMGLIGNTTLMAYTRPVSPQASERQAGRSPQLQSYSDDPLRSQPPSYPEGPPQPFGFYQPGKATGRCSSRPKSQPSGQERRHLAAARGSREGKHARPRTAAAQTGTRALSASREIRHDTYQQSLETQPVGVEEAMQRRRPSTTGIPGRMRRTLPRKQHKRTGNSRGQRNRRHPSRKHSSVAVRKKVKGEAPSGRRQGPARPSLSLKASISRRPPSSGPTTGDNRSQIAHSLLGLGLLRSQRSIDHLIEAAGAQRASTPQTAQGQRTHRGIASRQSMRSRRQARDAKQSATSGPIYYDEPLAGIEAGPRGPMHDGQHLPAGSEEETKGADQAAASRLRLLKSPFLQNPRAVRPRGTRGQAKAGRRKARRHPHVAAEDPSPFNRGVGWAVSPRMHPRHRVAKGLLEHGLQADQERGGANLLAPSPDGSRPPTAGGGLQLQPTGQHYRQVDATNHATEGLPPIRVTPTSPTDAGALPGQIFPQLGEAAVRPSSPASTTASFAEITASALRNINHMRMVTAASIRSRSGAASPNSGQAQLYTPNYGEAFSRARMFLNTVQSPGIRATPVKHGAMSRSRDDAAGTAEPADFGASGDVAERHNISQMGGVPPKSPGVVSRDQGLGQTGQPASARPSRRRQRTASLTARLDISLAAKVAARETFMSRAAGRVRPQSALPVGPGHISFRQPVALLSGRATTKVESGGSASLSSIRSPGDSSDARGAVGRSTSEAGSNRCLEGSEGVGGSAIIPDPNPSQTTKAATAAPPFTPRPSAPTGAKQIQT